MQLRLLVEGSDTAGCTVAVVMQVAPEQARQDLTGRYAVPYPVLCDPERRAYAAYGLWRATTQEILTPRVFVRAALTTLQGHFVGKESGDAWQMPGVFAIHCGGIIAAVHYPKDAADNPSDTALREMMARATTVPGAL